jgi:hypothetical protein
MKKFYYLLILALIWAGCKKDDEEECCDPTNPECANYDPCFGKEEPTAAFLMEDRSRGTSFSEVVWIAEDSLFRGSEIRFRSPYEGAEYIHTWYVGAEVLSGHSVQRFFSDVPRPQIITISHVIEYPVDSICYPLSSGRDSVAQSFRLIDYYNELLTIGNTFRGAFTEQVDTFEFKFRILNPDGSEARQSDTQWNVSGINFHNTGDSLFGYEPFATNTYLTNFVEPTDMQLFIDKDEMTFVLNYLWLDLQEYEVRGRVLN